MYDSLQAHYGLGKIIEGTLEQVVRSSGHAQALVLTDVTSTHRVTGAKFTSARKKFTWSLNWVIEEV
jgi:hypothetical protein